MKKYYLDNGDRVKQYYLNNHDRLTIYQKNFNYENREKINLYIKNRLKLDVNFRIVRNTRRRIDLALNGNLKSSSTGEILGIDIQTYKKLIEWQMTPEMNWTNIELDHVRLICMFDVSKDEELREAFIWKNTQPLLKEVHQQKRIKFFS